MVIRSAEKQTAFVFWNDEKFEYRNPFVTDSGMKLVPYSANNNLIKNDVVLLPSEPEEYESEEELVIKALDDQTIATDLVSGASILGDGRVVLIMNLGAVVGRFTTSARDGVPAGLFHGRAAQNMTEARQ